MHVRYLYLGSVVLLLGLSLWLMEEAALLAPVLFPKRWLPLGGDGSFQAIFSAVALSGFPLGGIAIRPADSSAARSLLHTWTTLCLVLATVFTLTTAIIFTFDHDFQAFVQLFVVQIVHTSIPYPILSYAISICFR